MTAKQQGLPSEGLLDIHRCLFREKSRDGYQAEFILLTNYSPRCTSHLASDVKTNNYKETSADVGLIISINEAKKLNKLKPVSHQ